MKRALVVDDNPLAVDGIIHSIDWESLGIEISGRFCDGQSVLSYLKDFSADIIISDIRMPGMSGLEMVERITADSHKIKIILISAYSDFQYVQDALRIGAFDYLEKPVDYDYLYGILKKAAEAIDRENRILEELHQSRDALVQSFFYNLIHSNPEASQYRLSDYIPFLTVPLSARFYLTAVAETHNIDAVKKRSGLEAAFICQMGLKNEMEQLFISVPFVRVLFDYDCLVLILGLDGESRNDAAAFVNDRLTALLQRTAYHTLEINIGIGSTVPSIWHLSESYKAAVRALEYRFFFPQKSIFDVRDFSNRRPPQDSWNSSLEEKLIQFLCRKDSEGIEQYMEQLAVLFSMQQDKKNVFIILYSLTGKIIKFLYDIDINMGEIRNDLLSLYRNIDDYASSDELCTKFKHICLDICETMHQSRESYQNQLCKQVQEFIDSNYSNQDLSLSDIASYSNISSSHLSTVFKMVTGITISDAITAARINEARVLLSNTSFPIKDICERVGYSNQYYFSACFKKHTGITPSAFRSAEAENS
ncbi:response regulator transcription factor [Breznakiella homolactica]|uniref:Response regulator n=1 Tax=Breznakiella homolactica TaxID=2798577 RepID=A0A7T8BC42_9SPIR|nr:response regulator [Breznakiella homolactica]QQO09843.1 response regulator [Breznakiella homolactica]